MGGKMLFVSVSTNNQINCERFYIKTLLIRMGLNKRWLSWFWGGGTINKAVMFLVRISRKPSPDLSTYQCDLIKELRASQRSLQCWDWELSEGAVVATLVFIQLQWVTLSQVAHCSNSVWKVLESPVTKNTRWCNHKIVGFSPVKERSRWTSWWLTR